MEKTLERLEEADLVLFVVDGTRPPPALPDSVLGGVKPSKWVLVRNKSDLFGQKEPAPLPAPWAEATKVDVSAWTGEGIERLTEVIGSKADGIASGMGEEDIAVNARHAEALRRARECLEMACAQIRNKAPTELLASDLRGALDAFGEIGGRIDNEAMLDRLFATFCIGK
jgi:tRNA modification GTPase